jgi:monoamine oxidase
VSRLDEMSKEVPVDAPWTSAKAAEYDGQTLDSWVRANTNPLTPGRFHKLVAAATRPIFGAEPSEISLLFTLFYIAASGNESNAGTFERNFNTREGAQMFRYVGGSQRIALELARRLGRRVILKSPVRQIRNGARGVSVVSDRINVRAKFAIVAVPPVLAGRIDYTPDLPPERDALSQRLPQGSLGKVAAVYDRPFWREQGLNGTALHLEGPVNAIFDDSPPDGSPGVLFGFVGGDAYRGFFPKSPADRRADVLRVFGDCFGAEAASPRDYFDTNWPAERWSRGGPVGIAGPGVYTALGPALRRPVGRIHWAGTETSTYWNGYMDGAVRSGERAAREVLDQL